MTFVTNKRDRNLLLFLGLAIVFYLCYTLVINPALIENETMQIEMQSMEDELERTENMIATLPQLSNDVSQLQGELTTKYSRFMPDLNQARILYQLDELMATTGLRVTSYIPTLAVASPVVIEQGTYLPQSYPLLDVAAKINPELMNQIGPSQEGSSTESGTNGADTIPSIEVAVNFDSSSFESLYGFILAVEAMDKTVVLKNISISNEVEGLQGQLLLTFYSLPPLDESQNDYLKFMPSIPLGKPNPFK